MYPHDFVPFFEGTMTIEQYVELDEAVVLYYLKNGLMKMILYSVTCHVVL